MASTRVFKLLMGFKTSDTPDAWTGIVYRNAAVMMLDIMGTICFFTLSFTLFFLVNVVTVIFSLFIIAESFLFTMILIIGCFVLYFLYGLVIAFALISGYFRLVFISI